MPSSRWRTTPLAPSSLTSCHSFTVTVSQGSDVLVLADDVGELEDGQEHGHNDTADDDAEESDKERLHQGGEGLDQGVDLGVVEIGHFHQHAVDVAGLLARAAHVLDHGGEVGISGDHVGDLSALADVL